MKSFLTGSRIYGTPKNESDVDLVILLSCTELSVLRQFADADLSVIKTGEDYGPVSASLKFGKLNLIVTTSESVFAAWRVGTGSLCQKGRKIERPEAVQMFKMLFAMLIPPEHSEQSVAAIADVVTSK